MGESTVKKVVDATGMWWPDADSGKLRQVADAWRAMAEALDGVTAASNRAAQTVIGGNNGPAIDAFHGFWNRYYDGGKGALPDTAKACRQLASACDQFADQIDQAIHKLEEEAAIAGAALIGGTVLAFFTAGISEAAAGAATAGIVAAADAIGVTVSETVASIAATTLTGVAFGAVESTAVDALIAQPVRIAFGDGGFSGTELLSSAETGGVMGGVAGGLGAGARAVSTAAESADGASTALAAVGKISAGMDTVPGRMVMGAGLSAGQDAIFNGGVNPLDVALGGIGAAAAPKAPFGRRGPASDRITPPEGADAVPGLELKTQQLGQLSDESVVRLNGLVHSIDGHTVKDFATNLGNERAQMYQDARAAGEVSGKKVGGCIGVGIDRRTGLVYESLNGPKKSLIPDNELHPLIEKRLNDLVAAGPYPNGDGGTQPHPHADEPLRHAEVKMINQMLWDRQARGLPVDESALREINVHTHFPFMGGTGKPAPFCANCHNLLGPVLSAPGRFTAFPADDTNWTKRW